MKTLLIYYSYEGATALMADAITDEINSDKRRLYVIDEKRKIGFKKMLWGGLQVFRKQEPEISPLNIDIRDYDLIIIGTPVWAGSYVPAIRSFLANSDFTGLNVAYFYTHLGGSGNIERHFDGAFAKANVVGKLGLSKVRNDIEDAKLKACEWAKNLTID